jgi:hypothetical protein
VLTSDPPAFLPQPEACLPDLQEALYSDVVLGRHCALLLACLDLAHDEGRTRMATDVLSLIRLAALLLSPAALMPLLPVGASAASARCRRRRASARRLPRLRHEFRLGRSQQRPQQRQIRIGS